MELSELAPGIWRWDDSLYVERPDAVVLIDPVVPAGEEERFFKALDRDVERLGRPVVVLLDPAVPAGDEERFFGALDRDVERLGLPVVVLLTDASLDAGAFVERYGAKLFTVVS